MKCFLVIWFFLIPVTSFGNEVVTTGKPLHEAMGVNLSKAQEWLKSKGWCEIVIGRPFDKAHSDYIYPTVLCVGDMALGEGSISSNDGCTLTELNLKTGQFSGSAPSPYNRHRKLYVSSKKKCSSGGLDELMSKTFIKDYSEDGRTSRILKVKEVIETGRGTVFVPLLKVISKK